MAGLDKPLARAKMQATFASRVVAPLWRALAALADGKLDEPLLLVDGNVAYYVSECERLTATKNRIGGLLSRLSRRASTTSESNKQRRPSTQLYTSTQERRLSSTYPTTPGSLDFGTPLPTNKSCN